MLHEDNEGKCVKIEEKEKWNRIFKEYKTLTEDVRSRESSTLVVGSILAFISFVIFSDTATNSPENICVTFVLMFASLGIYTVWMIFYCTSKRLDNIYYKRMEECLEPKLCFKVRKQIHDEIKCECWFKFRRAFWCWAGVFLFIVWVLFIAVYLWSIY